MKERKGKKSREKIEAGMKSLGKWKRSEVEERKKRGGNRGEKVGKKKHNRVQIYSFFFLLTRFYPTPLWRH